MKIFLTGIYGGISGVSGIKFTSQVAQNSLSKNQNENKYETNKASNPYILPLYTNSNNSVNNTVQKFNRVEHEKNSLDYGVQRSIKNQNSYASTHNVNEQYNTNSYKQPTNHINRDVNSYQQNNIYYKSTSHKKNNLDHRYVTNLYKDSNNQNNFDQDNTNFKKSSDNQHYLDYRYVTSLYKDSKNQNSFDQDITKLNQEQSDRNKVNLNGLRYQKSTNSKLKLNNLNTFNIKLYFFIRLLSSRF